VNNRYIKALRSWIKTGPTSAASWEFRKSTHFAVLGIALALAASVCGADEGPKITAEVRTSQALTQGWKFVQDDSLTDAAALASTGQNWQDVSLPHTWNAQDAASTKATVPYKRGLGWYRLEFDTPAAGVRKWLEFGAASIVADVWLNGQKLGQHRGAFTAFRFDVTDKLAASGRNFLLVKVDNRAARTGNEPTAIAPLGGDFNMSGGLYRDVKLAETAAPVHFDLGDMGGPGVYATTVAVTDSHATLNVRAKLKSDSTQEGDYLIRVSVLDASGQLARSVQKTVTLKAGSNVEVAQDVAVDHAHLWQGVDDPYQYRLVAELVESDGTTIDKVVQDFGIRQMRFAPNEGFFLNGKHVPLHGVDLHQDALGKGWAISTRDIDESLGLIKEMGANSVRLAHYPHSPYTLERASQLGLVVWAELPLVNQTSIPGCGGPVTDAFKANAKQQLQEQIRQQYNRAAVAMWSVGNETTQGCIGSTTPSDNITPLLRELQTLAKAEDSSRVTTYGDWAQDVPYNHQFTSTGGITDIWAINRYYLWYYGSSAAEFGAHVDALHAKYPNQPIGISEYGAGSAVTQHSDNPLGGRAESFNTGQPVVYQPEEYASYVHEQIYGAIASRKYIWGSFVWSMFDFGSGIRNEGDVRGVNTKGLVTYDRKTKKDAFYFYKANWSSEPVTYITGRRYTNRAYATVDVKVYSNADSVQLSLNGTTIGTLTQDQCTMKVCVFRNVKLSPGANKLTATGNHGGRTVNDLVDWSLNTQDVRIAAGQYTTGLTSSTGALFGSDNFFVGGTADWLVSKSITDQRFGVFDRTAVNGTVDPQLFSNVRRGTFSYDIPLDNGTYSVTLGFLEPGKATAVGGRVFSVDANGVTVLAKLDVLAAAGAYRTVITRTFPVTVTSGRLKLDFKPSVGEAVVSNIAITKN
jgi:beta-galactosidase